MTRSCKWCRSQLPATLRADAIFCNRRCRQASFCFAVCGLRSRLCGPAATRSMRFGYADPPYPGRHNLYAEKTAVDHVWLVDYLRRSFPDGWALSTSADALQSVWKLCPETRLHVWVKLPRPTRSRRAISSWEALLVSGGREQDITVVSDLHDSLVYRGRFSAFPGALIGMKPPAFCSWLFRLLGAMPGDELTNLYPGSGAVMECWRRYLDPQATAMKRAASPSPAQEEA